MILIYVLMALVGAAALVFAMQNPTPVAVAFLVWQTGSMPLSLVILLSALAGVIVAAVAGLAQHVRLRLRVRQLEARVAQLSARGPVVAPPAPPSAAGAAPRPPRPAPPAPRGEPPRG